jgi:hypothetical protein
MNFHIVPHDSPLSVQIGQCKKCFKRDMASILMIVGCSRTWILADKIEEGFRVHECEKEQECV